MTSNPQGSTASDVGGSATSPRSENTALAGSVISSGGPRLLTATPTIHGGPLPFLPPGADRKSRYLPARLPMHWHRPAAGR